MARLSNPDECRGFIASWRSEGGTRGLRHLRWALDDMRENVRACESDGRWPGDMRPDECRESVRLLERAVEQTMLTEAMAFARQLPGS